MQVPTRTPPTLTIEAVSAFNGLHVLVARDERLFAAEGLQVNIARPRPAERDAARLRATAARWFNPPATRGSCSISTLPTCFRVESAAITAVSRSARLVLGRSAAARWSLAQPEVFTPDSSVYTPQDLARKLVGLDYGNGTAYAGLQMLEGAMPRKRSAPAPPARTRRNGYACSGASRQTSGKSLARRGDVVVVTLNHRPGVLGYLRLGYLFGQEYAAAGVAVATGPRAGARVGPR